MSSDLEEKLQKNFNNILIFLGAGCLWAIFFGIPLNNQITNSNYVTYGGEAEALIAAIFQCVIYLAGFIPCAVLYDKRKKLKSEIQKKSDVLKPLSSKNSLQKPSANKEEKVSKSSDNLKKSERKSVEEKLKELKRLYDKKLISKSVYDKKQKDIIDNL